MSGRVVTLELSRREFLVAANATALLVLLESCVPGAASHIAATPATGGNPYERALRLLREAVRKSPDHLAQRAADLAAAKDAGKIVEFVRDQLSVLPPWSFLDDHRNARRWGIAGTLRAGQGTLRDRAEVLADMLSRAGLTAHVMTADRPSTIDLARLYQPRSANFVPDPHLIEQAKAQLHAAGAPTPASPEAFDPGPDAAAAILAALPSSFQKARIREDLLPPKVPVVVFEQGGRKRYAMALGEVGVTDTEPAGLADAQSPDPTPNVTITVSAIASPAPGTSTPAGKLIDLVTGRWPLESVIGRQALLTFVPPAGGAAYLQSSLASQPIRIPILRLQGDDATKVATGPLISVHGEVATADQAPGAVAGPLGSVLVLSEADRKKAAAAVATVQVAANATAFTDVSLDVNLVDGSGAAVDGLDAASFSLAEDGRPVGSFTLMSNVRSQQRPRVMLAYDSSGSVLRAWPSPAARAAFERSLGKAFVDAAAATPFDLQVVQLGEKCDPNGWHAPDGDAIAKALGAGHSDDETWKTIAGPALDQGLAAIVYVGDSTDDFTAGGELAALQHRLAASKVPVFVIPTGPPANASTQRIVDLSGGARLALHDPAAPSRIAEMVRARAAQWVGGGYRIRYIAPRDGASERQVTVAIATRPQVAASARYTVPAKPLSPPSFAGLYVTIEVGGLRTTRRIAGHLLNYGGSAVGQLDDAAALAETRAALDGITTIAIEPGTPTTAALLDDVLTSLISLEPLRSAWPVRDLARMQAATRAGVLRTPGLLMSLLLPSAKDPNALPGFRVAILNERVPSDLVVERHADLAIGANPMLAVTADAHAGFLAAVANSVAACERESRAFDDSAYARLSGRKLVALPVADGPSRTAFYRTLPAEKVGAWALMSVVYWDKHLVVPDAGGGDALWVVDPDSGAAKAVLLDSTGGAISQLKCKFSPYAEMAITLSILAIMCSAAEATGAGCLGINSAATAMTVAALFIPGEADAGTPFGAAYGLINPFGGAKGFGGFGAGVGIALLIVTIQASCS